MEFTTIEPSEISSLQALAKKIWNENYTEMISQSQIDYMLETMYSKEVIEDSLKKSHFWYWMEVKNEKIGFLQFYPKENYMFIGKIYIDKKFQAKGYATEAMNFIKEKTESLGLNTMELTVNKNNPKAIKFYTKYGFTKKKEIVVDIGNGFVMDDYVMEYKIPK